VRFAKDHPNLATQALAAQAEDEQRRMVERWFRSEPPEPRETIARVRVDLNRTMEEGCGIYRSEQSLRETCDRIRDLKERYKRVTISDKSNSFNTELTSALELGFLIEGAEAVVFSALNRKESRGSHQRSDFPQRDDKNFLKHSLAFRTDGDPRIELMDVVITKWPPEERVYGAKK
jgi:fumarate reductase flavoprotein subunit